MSGKAKPAAGPTGPARPDGLAERAAVVLQTLAGLEPELKSAAVLSDDGVIASTVDDPAWQRSARELTQALEAAGPGELDSSHIATAEAEVFVVSEAGFSLVAVTERFVLASLTSFDVRMSLRDLALEQSRA